MQSRTFRNALLTGAWSLAILSVPVRAGLADLTAAIDAARGEHGITATAFFVVSGSTILALEALGTTSRDDGKPLTPDHLVRIGSITKTVTALTVMTQVERGRLSLATPVASIISPPPYRNAWSATHPVVAAHLLEHTAGLGDLSRREFDFNSPVSLAEAFAVDPESRRLRWPPGLHASYSNSGAGILSAVLEHVSGTAFTALVEREIFRPLGMRSARFSLNDSQREQLISGYDSDGRTPIPYWHTLYPAFGGINVSPRDMLPLVQLFLNRGRHQATQLIPERGIVRIENPATSLAARAGLDYGYGLGLYDYERHGVLFHGHGGDADGYLSHFGYSTDLDRGYFVVINAFKQRALRRMRRLIEDELIGDYTPPPPPPPSRPAAEHLRRLAGDYVPASSRFGRVAERPGMKILATTGGLVMHAANGQRRKLVPVSAWHYRNEGEFRATIAFIACSGQIYFQGDAGNFVKAYGPVGDAPPCIPTTIDAAIKR